MRRCSAAPSSGLRFATSVSAREIERVEQVVGFDALTLSAGHVDESALVVRRIGGEVAERPGGGVRQGDHLIGKMRRPFGLLCVSQRPQRLLQQLLQIRLPHVDHVVSRRARPNGGCDVSPGSPPSTTTRCHSAALRTADSRNRGPAGRASRTDRRCPCQRT